MDRSWMGLIIVFTLLVLMGIAAMAVAYFRALRLARKRLADLGSLVLALHSCQCHRADDRFKADVIKTL